MVATDVIQKWSPTGEERSEFCGSRCDFRARDWQRGLLNPAAPNTSSNGTSSLDVAEIDIEDREVIMTFGTNGEQIGGLSRKELVERAERRMATVVRQKSSAALAGGATFVAAQKLPSGGEVMVTNNAAEPEFLHKRTGWLMTLGHGS